MGGAVTFGEEVVAGSESQNAPVLKIIDGGEAADLSWSWSGGGSEAVDAVEGGIEFVGAEVTE